MKNLESMKDFIRNHNLTHLARELVAAGYESAEAIEYVYDSHTMTKVQFMAKYF